MDIWHEAGAPDGPALVDLLERAAATGHALVPRALPHGDGLPGGPVLLWHEEDDPTARARALMAGADDIIGPWMHREEALARLLRLAGRGGPASAAGAPPQPAHRLLLGDLDIDLIDHKARRAERPLGLLAREYQLLLHLARHCGAIQSRQALLAAVWRFAFDPGTNVVEVHVSRLRAKLDRGFAWPMLRTVRGAGYCLVAQG